MAMGAEMPEPSSRKTRPVMKLGRDSVRTEPPRGVPPLEDGTCPQSEAVNSQSGTATQSSRSGSLGPFARSRTVALLFFRLGLFGDQFLELDELSTNFVGILGSPRELQVVADLL